MALPDLDPRNGGTCGNLMAKKFVNYIVGLVDLIIWTCALFTFMFEPSSMNVVMENSNTAALVIAILIVLASIAFSILFLIGLYKDRRSFVKSYCIFTGTYVVLLMISFVVNIFVQPQNLGFRGFCSTVICIFIHIVFLIVARCYYLLTYCNDGRRAVNQAPV